MLIVYVYGMANTLTSAEAAAHLGVTVAKWHRIVHTENLTPAAAAPGLRGARWWKLADVNRIARQLNNESETS